MNLLFYRVLIFQFCSAVIKLSGAYYDATGDLTPFNSRWKKAMQSIMEVIKAMQMGSDEGTFPYFFQRETTVPTDTLMFGTGPPGKEALQYVDVSIF